LLFELLNRRYEKEEHHHYHQQAFSQWHEVFPSARCIVGLADRLVHRSEVIAIEGKSYRVKEAEEPAERNQRRPSVHRKNQKLKNKIAGDGGLPLRCLAARQPRAVSHSQITSPDKRRFTQPLTHAYYSERCHDFEGVYHVKGRN
jgi:hypothetical protein